MQPAAPTNYHHDYTLPILGNSTMVLGFAVALISAIGITLALTNAYPGLITFNANLVYSLLGGIAFAFLGMTFILLNPQKEIVEQKVASEVPLDLLQTITTVSAIWDPKRKDWLAENFGLIQRSDGTDWTHEPQEVVFLCMFDKLELIMPVSLFLHEECSPKLRGETVSFLYKEQKYVVTLKNDFKPVLDVLEKEHEHNRLYEANFDAQHQ